MRAPVARMLPLLVLLLCAAYLEYFVLRVLAEYFALRALVALRVLASTRSTRVQTSRVPIRLIAVLRGMTLLTPKILVALAAESTTGEPQYRVSTYFPCTDWQNHREKYGQSEYRVLSIIVQVYLVVPRTYSTRYLAYFMQSRCNRCI